MKPADDGEIVFLDVRSSVAETERQLGGCLAASHEDLPTCFLYFDDRGQPLDAVQTSETSVALRPRDEAPNKELLWAHILSTHLLRWIASCRRIQTPPNCSASGWKSFEEIATSISGTRSTRCSPIQRLGDGAAVFPSRFAAVVLGRD